MEKRILWKNSGNCFGKTAFYDIMTAKRAETTAWAKRAGVAQSHGRTLENKDGRMGKVLSINQYVRAQSLDEAYTLCQKKNNVVIGGMLWLKIQKRPAGTAIDLCDLGLDRIEEDENEYRIGAMVSLRALEQHAGLAALTHGAMEEAVKHIVGVQFRNCATVGGSLFGIPGMVIGVPTLAVIVTLLKQAVGAGLTARGIDEDGNPLPDTKN